MTKRKIHSINISCITIVSTGGGSAQLEEQMNLPSLTNRTFINLERKLGEDLEEIVTPELIVAGEEAN